MPTTTTVQPNGNSILAIHPVNDRSQSQWLFTQSELDKSPSIQEGMPRAQELANRQKGVNFITQVGIMLKLPQLTLATAAVFLHRFYMRHPMQVSKDKGIHHYQVAATALFLATKVEENCRKMRELIVACCRVAQKQPNLVVDDHSKEYWKWRDTILHNEDVLLEALCFDLQLEQPYRILFDFLCYYGVQEHKSLRNTSWAFLNDSHITTLCLLFPPRTIAGAALYAGAKLTQVTLPDDDQGKPWWQHLELDIFDIQKTCNVMAEVYENPVLPRQGQKDAYLREDDIMSFDRTRRTQSPSAEPSPAYSQRSASQGIKRERESSWGHEQQPAGHRDAQVTSRDSASGLVPSPKRPRTNSLSNGEHQGSSRIPASAESRIPKAVQDAADDVQQKIDDIVNASNASSGNRAERPRRSTPEGSEKRHGQEARPEPGHAATNGSKLERPNHQEEQSHDRNEAQQNIETGYVRVDALEDNAEEVDYGSEEGEV